MTEKKKLISPVRRLNPGEDIKYLLLIKNPDTDETYWTIITGREEAYNYIKNNIGEIDVDNSYIIANKMKEIDLDSLHSIYGFVNYVKKENNIIDEFDIDDYLINQNVSTSDPSEIGKGLESAGRVFTGLVDSFEAIDDDDD